MSKFQLTRLARPLQVALWGITLLLVLHFVGFAIAAANRTSHGYVVLYTSARLVREGADFSRLYDDAFFGQQTARFDKLYRDIYRPHSPITALMLLPLSDFSYAKSRVLWTAFNLLLLVAAGIRMLRELKARGVYLPLMISLLLLYDPLHINLELGQSYTLMFVLLVVAWVGYRRGDNRALGIALGLMLGLKTAGVFLWLLLLLQRRWSALAWGCVMVAALALISLPLVGVNAWLTYFREVSYFTGQPFLTVTAYQTPTSLFGHLFTYDATWNPAPLLQAPLLASLLTGLSLLGIIGLSVVVGIKRQRQPYADLTFAVFAIASVLIVPLALDYHYMLLLLPVMILVAQSAGWTRRAKGVLAVAVALIATAIAYRQPALAVGWLALLAYPKLYGALLLLGLAAWRSRSLTLKPFAVHDEPLMHQSVQS